MSNLPFANEIAVARAESEEAHAAGLINQQTLVCLQSIDILVRQHTTNPDITPALPGDDLIQQALNQWADLAALPAIGPKEDMSYAEKARSRQSQLELLQRHLGPIAAQAHSRAHRLSHLQEDQQRALAAPQWSETAARLRQVGAERDAAALELAELQQRAAHVRPLHVATSAYLARIDSETRSEGGGAARRELRLQVLAQDALINLASLLAVSALELAPLPGQHEDVGTIIQSLTDLNAALTGELQQLEANTSRQQARYDELTRAILDELG